MPFVPGQKMEGFGGGGPSPNEPNLSNLPQWRLNLIKKVGEYIPQDPIGTAVQKAKDKIHDDQMAAIEARKKAEAERRSGYASSAYSSEDQGGYQPASVSGGYQPAVINERREEPRAERERVDERPSQTKRDSPAASPSNQNRPAAPKSDGPALPDGWESTVDPKSGKTYFFNRKTNAVSWNPPPMPAAAPAASAAATTDLLGGGDGATDLLGGGDSGADLLGGVSNANAAASASNVDLLGEESQATKSTPSSMLDLGGDLLGDSALAQAPASDLLGGVTETSSPSLFGGLSVSNSATPSASAGNDLLDMGGSDLLGNVAPAQATSSSLFGGLNMSSAPQSSPSTGNDLLGSMSSAQPSTGSAANDLFGGMSMSSNAPAQHQAAPCIGLSAGLMSASASNPTDPAADLLSGLSGSDLLGGASRSCAEQVKAKDSAFDFISVSMPQQGQAENKADLFSGMSVPVQLVGA